MITKIKRVLLTSIISILTLPMVTALSGFGFMDDFVRTLAEFFTIPAIQSAPVQEGLIRFGIFMIVFAVANASLKKTPIGGDNKNRVSGIISFVVAFIGAFTMPREWVMATGGTIAAIVAAAIVFGLLGTGIWYAMFKLKDDWLKHFFGIVLLLTLLHIIIIYDQVFGLGMRIQQSLPIVLIMSKEFFRRFFEWQQ